MFAPIQIKFVQELALDTLQTIPLDEPAPLNDIPKTPGMYVLHHGGLIQAWSESKVFYIGATYREGLQKRAKKHRSVLLDEKSKSGKAKVPGSRAMKIYGAGCGNKLEGIHLSYFECHDDVPRYVPFILETVLLLEYEARHGSLPAVNKGWR